MLENLEFDLEGLSGEPEPHKGRKKSFRHLINGAAKKLLSDPDNAPLDFDRAVGDVGTDILRRLEQDG